MTVPLILFLQAVVILLSALSGALRRGTTFFLASLAGDLVRQLFTGLREGRPKPYTGVGFLLWLPDPALILAPACVLLGLVLGGKRGLTVWGAAFLTVAISYPSLRGDSLLAFYWTLFLVVYLVTTVRILWESSKRREMGKDDALLLLISLAGIGDVVLLKIFGVENWWGVWLIHVPVYVSAGGLAVLELLKRPNGKVGIDGLQ